MSKRASDQASRQVSKQASKQAGKQVIGRSRGGLTIKIHAVVDALGNPPSFEFTPGQLHHSAMGYEMLPTLDIQNREVLADRAYVTGAMIALLKNKTQLPSFEQAKLAKETSLRQGYL